MSAALNSRLLRREPLQRCQLAECRAACCLHGAWVDAHEARQILFQAALISPHLPPDQSDPAGWFDERREPDEHSLSGEVWHTRVLEMPWHYGGTGCVFLRPDYKCALQCAAQSAGLPPWRFKPFYCILHPLDLDEHGQITLDETAELLAEPASCLRFAPEPRPLLETFEPELRHFLGDRAYAHLKTNPDELP